MAELLTNNIDVNTSDNKKYLFEQYKLFVDLADRISQRRAVNNNFFITVNAALLTVASWFKESFGNYIYLISFVGIMISIFWFLSIRSYKQLNTGKFKVIHELENHLPAQMFSYEWEILGKGKQQNNYFPISHIEMFIPFIFIILYIALSIFKCFNF